MTARIETNDSPSRRGLRVSIPKSGVHLNLHGHECPPMLPPTPRYSDKLLRPFALLRPMLSLDKSRACPLRALLPLACKSQLLATLHPKRKVCVIGVCRGGTYATSATLRPLVGGVVLRLYDSMRSEPRQRAAFRTEPSVCTLAGVAPGRKPYYGDGTSCTPSIGHGPRHSV